MAISVVSLSVVNPPLEADLAPDDEIDVEGNVDAVPGGWHKSSFFLRFPTSSQTVLSQSKSADKKSR
jgi:hypothetical protein